jgi:hypothetical protein
MVTTVNCPQCGKAVPWQDEQRWKPFCSERCKLIDLGEWATEGHRIPGDPTLPISSDDSEEFH